MLYKPRFVTLVLLVCLLATTSLVAAQDQVSLSVPAAEQDATVLVKWMQLLYERVEAEKISAPAGSRLYAYAGIAAFESVLPGIPDGISLSGQLTGMPDMPEADFNAIYDWPSSADAALATVLDGLLPDTSGQAIAAMRDSLKQARLRNVDADVVERSMNYGDSVGQAVLDWAADDNYEATRNQPYELPTGGPSYWVYTDKNMVAVEPFWGQIRPFALYSADSCAVPLKMPFDADPASTFYAQAMEVKTTGDKLTNEQKDIARFWVDTPGVSGTPAGHWVLIENQMVDLLDLKLEIASMMYALVGIAVGDSFISAWSLKYQVMLLRPVTYIQEYIDPRWQPFIQTPGFPEYPSGHSVVSAAAAEVLTTMFGTVAFTDRSGRIHQLKDRSFTSFEAAASEAAISRMYGGIHFRAALENGMRQGRCIGQNVLTYISLRPIPQGE